MTGRYDDECAELCIKTEAKVAIMIIRDGAKGSGFSIAGSRAKSNGAEILEILMGLPDFLRALAAEMESEQRALIESCRKEEASS